MYKFAVKHPVIFEILLIVAAFLLALVFMIPGSVLYLSTEQSAAIGRILAGILIFLLFLRYFDIRRQMRGLVIALPAVAFTLWNVVIYKMTGGTLGSFGAETLILGLAPAIFEEVVFRFVFIENMRKNRMSPAAAMLLSGVVFGVIHMTNIAGASLAKTVLQVFYSTVVGIVFAAIYIRSRDLFSVVIAHAAIDISNRIFISEGSTPFIAVALFAALMIAEVCYAAWLITNASWQK